MAKTLPALLKLQSVELQLVEVRNRLRVQGAAVDAQQSRIAGFQEDYQKLHEELVTLQKEAAGFELELRSKEEGVGKLRGAEHHQDEQGIRRRPHSDQHDQGG